MLIRRKQHETPGLNTTSTADISFMLLIFFLVTTSMDVDKGLLRQLPSPEPQKKEQQKKNSMLAELAVGDTILTTSGFYGTVIDIADDTVIVEFGSNKNCRIPMQKAAIADLEKAEDSAK